MKRTKKQNPDIGFVQVGDALARALARDPHRLGRPRGEWSKLHHVEFLETPSAEDAWSWSQDDDNASDYAAEVRAAGVRS